MTNDFNLDILLNSYLNQIEQIKTNLKIAVEFYGHVRSFKMTADNIIENLIQANNNPDIFIHAWDETDHSDKTWHNPDGEKRGLNLTDDDIEFIKNKYNPKKILVEPQITPKENPMLVMKMTERETPYSNVVNIFYTKWKSNQLRLEYEKENNIKYDYVIQARLDMFFKRPFNIKDYIYQTTLNKNPIEIFEGDEVFYTEDIGTGLVYAPALIGGLDCFYFAKPNTLTKFVSVYENLDKINLEERFFSNEYLIMYNAKQEGLNPTKIKFYKDHDFLLIRSDGTPSCLYRPKTNQT